MAVGGRPEISELSPSGYSPAAEQPPLASYAAISVLFAAGYGALLIAGRRSDLELPDDIGLRDLVIGGAATYKLSRLIAKDRVTSFLRAPFRRRTAGTPAGEVSEEPRGSGSQRAIGELVGCPYCLGLWIGAGLSIGFAVAPRETRFAASTLTAVAVADFLQLAHRALRQDA